MKAAIDPDKAPCFICGVMPYLVHHTACEAPHGCDRVICDDCRFMEGNWSWLPGKVDGETTEMCRSCYLCRTQRGI